MHDNTGISNLEPKSLWKNFADICKYPHPSEKEQKLIEFVRKFGEDLGLKTTVDEAGNVLIKKPATPGMENRKTIILQGHLDMVPQKNSDVTHDFEKDPIKAYIDGEWVTAEGTTLGADNGIGVAAVMAVLEAKDLTHGPIEALFTTNEETGMTGAEALKPGALKGEILLNLDSEEEGEFCIGCAGGIYTDIYLKYQIAKVPSGNSAFKIKISGLKGGHSGCDIHLGRANANKIMARLLWKASKDFGIKIADISGGDLHNAIPREADATVITDDSRKNDLINFIKSFTVEVKNEFIKSDPNLQIGISQTDLPKNVMDENTQHNLLNAVYGCVNGVIRMSLDISGLTETSTNLAKVKAANGSVEILTFQRSAIESAKYHTSNMVGCIFELIGAEIKYKSDFPGWQPNTNSPILEITKKTYLNRFGKEPKIAATHGGLECGLIKAKYPKMDMISFGPTIKDPHSPDERVNIASVNNFWQLLTEVLKNVP